MNVEVYRLDIHASISIIIENLEATIKDVKDRIFSVWHIQPEYQRIIFPKHELPDTVRLDEFSVTNESRLYLLIRSGATATFRFSFLTPFSKRAIKIQMPHWKRISNLLDSVAADMGDIPENITILDHYHQPLDIAKNGNTRIDHYFGHSWKYRLFVKQELYASSSGTCSDKYVGIWGDDNTILNISSLFLSDYTPLELSEDWTGERTCINLQTMFSCDDEIIPESSTAKFDSMNGVGTCDAARPIETEEERDEIASVEVSLDWGDWGGDSSTNWDNGW